MFARKGTYPAPPRIPAPKRIEWPMTYRTADGKGSKTLLAKIVDMPTIAACNEAAALALAASGYDSARIHPFRDSEPTKKQEHTFARLAQRRARLAMLNRDLNEQVKAASGGRPHHQGCGLGGLFTGMAADFSGSPCWCGHDGWSKRGDE
jgi:hypothetical protein